MNRTYPKQLQLLFFVFHGPPCDLARTEAAAVYCERPDGGLIISLPLRAAGTCRASCSPALGRLAESRDEPRRLADPVDWWEPERRLREGRC
jgi:hypothetical protein